MNVMHQPFFPQERDLVPIVQEAGWVPGPVWTGAENLAPTKIQYPDRPACSAWQCVPIKNASTCSLQWGRWVCLDFKSHEFVQRHFSVFCFCYPFKHVLQTWRLILLKSNMYHKMPYRFNYTFSTTRSYTIGPYFLYFIFSQFHRSIR
jgi:hypothetical protein